MARRDYQDREAGKLNKHSFRNLLSIYQFMVPYRWYFVVGMACLFFSSLILLLITYLIGRLIDVASGQGTWYFNDIDLIAGLIMLVLFIQSFFSFFRVFFFARVSERSMADIRASLYQKLMTLPMTFFDSRRTGELMSRITADVALLQDTFSITLAEFFRQVLILVFGLALLLYTMPQLTLFMLGIVPVLVIAGLFFGRYIRKMWWWKKPSNLSVWSRRSPMSLSRWPATWARCKK
jgi:ABC-type multidrug transport system fused ATPase/permease subunit